MSLSVGADQIPNVCRLLGWLSLQMLLLLKLPRLMLVLLTSSTTAAVSGGLQPVKVVAPYDVSGVKLDNACPRLLYSYLSVIQENIPHHTRPSTRDSRENPEIFVGVWKMQFQRTHTVNPEISSSWFFFLFTVKPRRDWKSVGKFTTLATNYPAQTCQIFRKTGFSANPAVATEIKRFFG